MPFFDDMTTAIETYPVTDVTLEIVDVVLIGTALNVNETLSFRVKVSNNGPLNLTNVTVRVKGHNGALVQNGGAASPFVTEFVTQALPTIAHNSNQLTVGSRLQLKAPPGAQVSKTLVRATLEGWDGDLTHMLIGHSDPLDIPSGIYAAPVVIS